MALDLDLVFEISNPAFAAASFAAVFPIDLVRHQILRQRMNRISRDSFSKVEEVLAFLFLVGWLFGCLFSKTTKESFNKYDGLLNRFNFK